MELQNFDEVYDGHYISKKVFNNGDFDYKFVMEVIDYAEACGDKGFGISVNAVKTKKFLNKEKLKSVAENSCLTIKQVTPLDIFDYGLYGKIDDKFVETESEIEAILKEFDEQVPVYTTMFGFYMDRPMNRIGDTGWDFIDGNIGSKFNK